MANRTTEVPPRATSKLDGSWVVDTDEDDGSLSSPSVPTLNRSSTWVQATTSRQNENVGDYNLQKGPLGVCTGGDIKVDAVASDSGEDCDSPRISSTTSSQSLRLAYAGSSRQLSHASELADITRRRSARGGITAGASPNVEESSETTISSSLKPKSSKGKAVGLSQKFGSSSEASKKKSIRANPGTPDELDLIMPSIHEDVLESSWINRENSRRKKGTSRGSNVLVESEGVGRLENSRSGRLAPSMYVKPATIPDSIAD